MESRPTNTVGVQRRTRSYRIEGISRAFYRLRQSPLSLLGVGIIVGLFVVATSAPYIAPYPQDAYIAVHFERAFDPPSWQYPFGTDEAGRDILSRVIIGSRISILIGIMVLCVAAGGGVPLGLIAAYRGGVTEQVIMRIADIFLSVPPIALALAVTAALTPNLFNAILAICFVWWPWYARIVHGKALSVKQEQYVEASQSYGAGWLRIAFRDVLPNCMTPILVKATLDMGWAILLGASLGFLGLGAQPPTAEWGVMIATGYPYIPEYWWLTVFPGLAIFAVVLGFNFLGDGLRDVFDVQLEMR